MATNSTPPTGTTPDALFGPYHPRRMVEHRWERPVQAWLTWWHGYGAWHQADYFKCHGCGRVISWHRIRRGGCGCQRSNKLSPWLLPWYRKLLLICCPWVVKR